MKIVSTNYITTDADPKIIWDYISNIDTYKSWWPKNIKLSIVSHTSNILNDEIKVQPYGGMGFVCQIIKIDPPCEMTVKYSGVYNGIGVWKISNESNLTTVKYSIDLDTGNWMIRALDKIMSIEKIHHGLMEEVLKNLVQVSTKQVK